MNKLTVKYWKNEKKEKEIENGPIKTKTFEILFLYPLRLTFDLSFFFFALQM